MKSWFELDRTWYAEQREKGTMQVPGPSMGRSIIHGALGGMVLSVAGFVPWAVTGRWLYRAVGEAGLYGSCALVFIGLSGPLLHRLLAGPGSLRRFYRLFAAAFAAYAVAWIAGWMAWGGHAGSVAGLLAGAMAMGWVMVRAFGTPCRWLSVTIALFAVPAAGYFLGGVVEGWLMEWADGSRPRAIAAMLSWGVCFGLGFGAGLGCSLHRCQERVREQVDGAPA
jgi:hypothetical protein